MIALSTKRLLLRDHRPEDLESHHALLSDERVMRFLPELRTQTLAESEENLRTAVAESCRENRGLCFLRMEEAGSGVHVGEIGYTVERVTPAGKLVGVGYFIRDRFWGRGYTVEALAELIRFALEEDGVCRISCGCLKENTASERVMRKCGMIKEAEHRECQWHEGRLKDRVEYRLLRSEWKG